MPSPELARNSAGKASGARSAGKVAAARRGHRRRHPSVGRRRRYTMPEIDPQRLIAASPARPAVPHLRVCRVRHEGKPRRLAHGAGALGGASRHVELCAKPYTTRAWRGIKSQGWTQQPLAARHQHMQTPPSRGAPGGAPTPLTMPYAVLMAMKRNSVLEQVMYSCVPKPSPEGLPNVSSSTCGMLSCSMQRSRRQKQGRNWERSLALNNGWMRIGPAINS